MMYLLKALINIKRVYRFLKLEVSYLTWAVQKIWIMLKSAEKPVVILINHYIIKGIIEKTTLNIVLID